ncbi:transcriptional regulator, AlpA family [Marinobacterium sediminicola]|uniref:Transcriptional regulator, AlpA family n=1 Tax=Marinobacterium sediminicola TaxID=518898 RepID=A0ABY1RXQ3_9GAMM|nr:transcriptional regulator, AlpA family [Marinobacterium sediminicola]
MATSQPFQELRLVNERQFCELADICRAHLHNLVKSGSVPAPIYIGHAKRWRLTDIEAWINSLSQETH